VVFDSNLQNYGGKYDRQSAGGSEPGLDSTAVISPDIEDVALVVVVADSGSPSGHDGVVSAGRVASNVGGGIHGSGKEGGWDWDHGISPGGGVCGGNTSDHTH